MSNRENILVLSNSNWNIINFRRSFISFLQGENKIFVVSFLGQEKISIAGIEFVDLPNLKRNAIPIYDLYLYIIRLFDIIKKNDITRIYIFTFYFSSINNISERNNYFKWFFLLSAQINSVIFM